MADFIEITEDGDRITSPMPPADTIVEVRLKNGATALAWFDSNIMEPGDFDFLPLKEGEPDIEADSMAADVVAWRHSSADHSLRI